jgi:hypothetical protein
MFAQSYDSLYQNNVHAGFNASGDMFYKINPYSRGLSFNGSALTSCVGNLWIGGYDQNQTLHISAQTYRQTGSDFWSGPLDTVGAFCVPSANTAYNKVWKLYCSELDSFAAYNQGSPPAGTIVPSNIQTWPGNGDAALTEDHYMAPFVDVDGDDYYNWSAGDYPVIRGQQALWYVYNDSLQNTVHTETGGRSLGVEIQAMPYEFMLGWNNAVSNTLFIHYIITNRSMNQYDSTIVGFWTDLDLGFFTNTHSGSDSLLNCFYNYDSTLAAGIVFLNQPMAGCINYNNDFSMMGNPENPQQYYQYLNQYWKNGIPLTYSGNGYGGSSNSNWMYSGNPSAGTGWNDSPMLDTRNLGSTNAFTFYPGMDYSFDVALVFAKDSISPFGCVAALKQEIQEVKDFYMNEDQFCEPGLTGISQHAFQNNSISAFPDPAYSQLTLKSSSSKSQSYFIYDVSGKEVMNGKTNGTQTLLDIHEFQAGIYFIRVGSDDSIQTLRFVKTEE